MFILYPLMQLDKIKPFYLFGLEVAIFVTVGEVKGCELLSQFLLRAADGIQSCVQFNVTGTLWGK